MKKVILLWMIVFCVALTTRAQDHVYSQFYNAPQYLNPALNGQFDGDLRVNLIYRNQWTNIAGPLTYYTFSADLNVPKFGGGFGIMVTKSSEGTAYLSKTNFSGIYSYSVEFGQSGTLSFGIQGGITNRKIQYDKLLYYDQLNDEGIIPGGISGSAPPEFNNKFFFDSGAGVNVVVGNFMAGGAAHHINKPNESFSGNKSLLPMRINAYMSYKVGLDPYDDEGPSLIPSVVFYTQANVRSVSAGLQFKRRGVNAGLWYRGEGRQSDALVVSVILDIFVKRDYYDKVRLGFSHDATLSKLSYGNTAGTTEGALSYETTLSSSSDRDSYRSNNYSKRCYDFY